MDNIPHDKLLDYIAQGNLPVLSVGGIILFLILWIKYEKSLRSLFSWLTDSREREEQLKQKRSFEINTQLFFDKMLLIICKVESLKLSKDLGRNIFYHWVLKTLLSTVYAEVSNSCAELKEGKIDKESFCSFHKYQYNKILNLNNTIIDKLKKQLVEEKWSEEQINYVIITFNFWVEPHKTMLSELIKTSVLPEGVIMAYWVLFYELLLQIEKLGFLLNGKLTGLDFKGLTLGECDGER